MPSKKPVQRTLKGPTQVKSKTKAKGWRCLGDCGVVFAERFVRCPFCDGKVS